MRGQTGFFDIDERLRELSAKGDELERLKTLVDFELFRGDLERAVPRSDRSRGGRPAFDHVLMFKALILQASHSLSDERTKYLIKDRLSFMRFLDLGLANAVPDANTIWTFRRIVSLAARAGPWQPSRHDDFIKPVSRLPLPARGHRACRLALSLLQPEPT